MIVIIQAVHVVDKRNDVADMKIQGIDNVKI
jgi:hypothetical protein